MKPRTLHTFELEAEQLPDYHWTAHRDLAQEAAAAGYFVELSQEFTNSDSKPLIHSLRFFELADAPEELPDGISTDESSMGGGESVEQFSPDRPHGFFGRRTPLELSPVEYHDVAAEGRIGLWRGEEVSAHPTLTSALEEALRHQAGLTWISPTLSAQRDPDTPLNFENTGELLLDENGTVRAEHVLDAFRAVAEAENTTITVGTERDDLFATFVADFSPNGEWRIESNSVGDDRPLAFGSGPIAAVLVDGRISQAFETHVESLNREQRAQERKAAVSAVSPAAQAAVDAQAIGGMDRIVQGRAPAPPGEPALNQHTARQYQPGSPFLTGNPSASRMSLGPER